MARGGRILLLLVAILVAAACGEEAAGPADEPSPAATRASSPTPAATAPADDDCSASRLSDELPAQDLPRAVADQRRAIARAAVDCDYARLEQLAGDDGFTFSFGASNGAADHWKAREDDGEEVLATLVRLLALPFTRHEAGFYAWPPAYTEDPSPRDWELLRGIYDNGEIAAFRRHGTYLGHRVGITRDGEWRYFVAGD